MKFNYLLLFIGLISSIYIGGGEAKDCNENYNCQLPYEYCGGGWNIDVRSFGLGRDGKIYFTGRNKVPGTDNLYGPSYLVSVVKESDINNPGTNVVYKLIDEDPNNIGNYHRVNGIAGVNPLPNGKFLTILDVNRFFPLYSTYDPLEQKFTTVIKQNFQNSVFVDGNTLYRCIDNRLESVSPIPTTLNDTYNSKTLYNTNYCEGLVKVGNNLYLTQKFQVGEQLLIGFFITVANCEGCSLPSPIFTVTDPVVFSLAGDKDFFYYSTANGMFSVPINGDVSKRMKLSDNPNIKGILRDPSSNAIYYASRYSEGSSIVRINVDDRRITTLYYSNTNNGANQGTCQCNSAFTGSNCNNCNGTVNWVVYPPTNSPYPVCHPFKQNGAVSYCDSDWQCLNNSPYSYCSGSECICRVGFGGDKCQYCSSNNITWTGGIPTCNLYYHGYTTSANN